MRVYSVIDCMFGRLFSFSGCLWHELR